MKKGHWCQWDVCVGVCSDIFLSARPAGGSHSVPSLPRSARTSSRADGTCGPRLDSVQGKQWCSSGAGQAVGERTRQTQVHRLGQAETMGRPRLIQWRTVQLCKGPGVAVGRGDAATQLSTHRAWGNFPNSTRSSKKEEKQEEGPVLFTIILN